MTLLEEEERREREVEAPQTGTQSPPLPLTCFCGSAMHFPWLQSGRETEEGDTRVGARDRERERKRNWMCMCLWGFSDKAIIKMPTSSCLANLHIPCCAL